MSHLVLSLFGPLSVTLDGEPVTGFESDKVRALLAYLAVETGVPHRREKLAGLLWPNQPDAGARANLRHVLASLRKALGDRAPFLDGARSADDGPPPFLHVSRQTIQFNRASDAWVDVKAFTGLLQSKPPADGQTIHQLEEAVELVRGAFLEGFSLPGCSAFEEWALFEGERLQRMAMEALERLSDWHEKHCNVEPALDYAWRQVGLEPWREEAHQRVMRLLALGGKRGAALAQYESCRRSLVEGLGVEPGAETTQLYEQIRDGQISVWPEPPRQAEMRLALPGFLTGQPPPVTQPVFVARENELAWLDGLLEKALAGRGQVGFVVGGPGRGKTALLQEFARRALDAHPDLLLAMGTCNAYSGLGDPYLPFRAALAMVTGDAEAPWAAGILSASQARRLWNALPEVVPVLARWGSGMVGTLLPSRDLLRRARAVASPGEPAAGDWLLPLERMADPRINPRGGLEQSHLFEQYANVLLHLSALHPLLVIVDDLQWADLASVGLLFHLGRRIEAGRILLAGAYRPHEVAVGRDEHRHPLEPVLAEFRARFGDAWLDLASADEVEGRLFIDLLLDSEPNSLDEHFRQALFGRSRGHPLFTLELLRAMQQRGDLVLDPAGRWAQGDRLEWDALPARVEAAIAERIDRLPEELREMLAVASVEGEEFTAQTVALVLGLDELHILRTLRRQLAGRHRLVQEQGEMRRDGRGLSRYRFSHALFQKYLYDDLSDGERTLLHGEVAGVLEELYQDRLQEAAVQLARHFSEAGDEARALKYLILAGDGALAAYAHQEAEGYYRRALNFAPGEHEQAHLLQGLGEALYGQSRLQEAIRTWREGIELYRPLEDNDSVARLYARSAAAANDASDMEEAVRLCREGLTAVEGAPESPGLARLLHAAARAHGHKGLPEEGRAFAEQALEMAERLGDVEAQAEALDTLGGFYRQGEEAIELLAQAVELAESHALLAAASRARNNLAVALGLYKRDTRAALEQYRLAAELEGETGCTARQVHFLGNALSNLLTRGELEQAERLLSRARALLADLVEPTQGTQILSRVESRYLGTQGEWAASAQQARALQASARERGDGLTAATAAGLLAHAVLESRRLGGDATVADCEEAEAALAEAIEFWDRRVQQFRGVSARASLGSVRIEQGRLADARRVLAEGRQLASSFSATSALESTLQWLEAQIAGAEGRWGEAVAAHEAVAEFHARHGERWAWARSLLDWAEAHMARDEPGDRERAVELLREAHAAFEEMGIDRYAAIAQERLQELLA